VAVVGERKIVPETERKRENVEVVERRTLLRSE
jgi:hypothetical protein